ncbi:MAG: hypothetical protein WC699_13795 [Bacteroidales bacterium]|jgi:hypothetical protein
MPKLDFSSILSDSSCSLMEYTTAMVGHDAALFSDLMDLAYQQKSPLCMRAARVADLCSERNPELIRPHLVRLIRDLPDLKDMAVKRVFMHILIRHSWVENEEVMGKLVDTLFKWLMDDTQAVSVRNYSMVILQNISKIWPDLKGEMIAVLEETIPLWDSAALQSVGRKRLRQLRKEKFNER